MLYSAGMGAGILLGTVQEPVFYVSKSTSNRSFQLMFEL
jgi:choline-glycine betaine transporter